MLTDATERVMRHLPGFRSANIHVSVDGTRVVTYAQWDDPDAFAAMQTNATAREHMRACRGTGLQLRSAPLHRRVGASTSLIYRPHAGYWGDV